MAGRSDAGWPLTPDLNMRDVTVVPDCDKAEFAPQELGVLSSQMRHGTFSGSLYVRLTAWTKDRRSRAYAARSSGVQVLQSLSRIRLTRLMDFLPASN